MPIWMIVVEWLARLIFAGLIGLSIWSITIILERRRFIKSFDREKACLEIKELMDKYQSEKQEKSLNRYLFKIQTSLQKGLAVLGTLGSITPFIGLLGTILGIIVAFGELSQGSAGTNAIMFALAEALILTAVGLFVAIPAVVAFNLFNKEIKNLLGDLRTQADEYSLGD